MLVTFTNVHDGRVFDYRCRDGAQAAEFLNRDLNNDAVFAAKGRVLVSFELKESETGNWIETRPELPGGCPRRVALMVKSRPAQPVYAKERYERGLGPNTFPGRGWV